MHCSTSQHDLPSAIAYSISVTFIDKQGKEVNVQAPVGKNLLEVAHDNEIDLEGEQRAHSPCLALQHQTSSRLHPFLHRCL
jgi:hypothetical protein